MTHIGPCAGGPFRSLRRGYLEKERSGRELRRPRIKAELKRADLELGDPVAFAAGDFEPETVE